MELIPEREAWTLTQREDSTGTGPPDTRRPPRDPSPGIQCSSMWALLPSAVLGVTLQNPPASPPVPCLYKPLPSVEWSRGVDLKEAAPVVVVASRLGEGEPPVIFGNGVVIESNDASSRVLTCAHVVRRMSKDAVEIRVGVFRHSFVIESREGADYQEVGARLLRAGDGIDLAIVEIPVGGIRTARIASGSATHGQRHVISIVPFGRPTLMRSWHPSMREGQSGSPDLREGVVFGIVEGYATYQGQRMHGLERFVYAGEIQGFLDELRDFPPNSCDASV
jgi:hypothetical protein